MTVPITGQERRGARRIVHGAARRAAARTTRFWTKYLGLHVVPAKYDDPIPRLDELSDEWWDGQPLIGIDFHLDAQVERLAEWSARYRAEWTFPEAQDPAAPHLYHRRNPTYGNGDAEMLWSMLREHRPARVLELGSGMTTRLAAQALERNRAEGAPCELTAVDPFPGEVTAAGFPGLTRLVVGRAQDVPLDEFRRLGRDDVLLIDSSHMYKAGSDVANTFDRVLPSLAEGVLVHFHDIYLPRPYPPVVFRDQRWFWNEQDVLRAYLCENPSWEVLWSINALYRDRHQAFAAAIPGTTPGHPGPCSLWLRRIAPPSPVSLTT